MRYSKELGSMMFAATLLLTACEPKVQVTQAAEKPDFGAIDNSFSIKSFGKKGYLIRSLGSYDSRLDDLKKGTEYLERSGCDLLPPYTVVDQSSSNSYGAGNRTRQLLVYVSNPDCAPEVN